jgi:hypothetical protein
MSEFDYLAILIKSQMSLFCQRLTSAKSDSNLNAVDCGDFSAPRIKVLLDVRDEDAEAETNKQKYLTQCCQLADFSATTKKGTE